MKLEFLWEAKLNEIEARLIIDTIIGWVALLIGVFFDPIAQRLLLHHNEGFSLGQWVWCAFWGLYNIWTGFQLSKWKE